MQGDPATQLLDKKAFEISYAVFRVAEFCTFRPFAERIQNQAMYVLEDVTAREYDGAALSLSMLYHFIQLGASVDLISRQNGDLILGEIRHFNSAIAELGNKAKERTVSLEGVFSSMPEMVSAAPLIKKEVSMAERVTAPATQSKTTTQEVDSETEQSNQGIFKVAMRHSAILSKIRQIGNCRLKEIQEALPDVSERTIRYDLQRLTEQGLIERIGSGGPATYYHMK